MVIVTLPSGLVCWERDLHHLSWIAVDLRKKDQKQPSFFGEAVLQFLAIPHEHLYTQRRATLTGPDKYPTECIGWLEDFLAHPPDCVHIYYDFVVCNKKEIRIPFSPSMDVLFREHVGAFQVFLMDYTFQTNVHDLLLGTIGAAGLNPAGRRGLPTVGITPVIFCISTSEDKLAHHILLELYEKYRS